MEESAAAHLSNLISSDTQITTVLRAVLEKNQLSNFRESLNKLIKSSEVEIERLCKLHYQDFLASLNEITQIKQEISQLRLDLKGVNSKLQETGFKQLTLSTNLLQNREVLKNIALSAEALDNCLPVLKAIYINL
jgi:uncharacterized membrane protein YgaE (UPF0421/DUF939 family)